MNEQRHFLRIPFRSHSLVRCLYKGHDAELLDISLRGALFRIDTGPDIPLNTLCDLTIDFSGSDIHLQFSGELVHREEKTYGFHLGTTDLDSFTHLRRLLELNTGDPEEIDRELFDWLKRE